MWDIKATKTTEIEQTELPFHLNHVGYKDVALREALVNPTPLSSEPCGI